MNLNELEQLEVADVTTLEEISGGNFLYRWELPYK